MTPQQHKTRCEMCDPSVTEHTHSGQNVKHFNCMRKRTLNSSVIKVALCAVGFMHFIFCVFSPATVEMAKRTTSWLDTTLPMWHICRLRQLWKRSLRKNIHHHQEALEWQSLYFHSSHILTKTKNLVYVSVWYITGACTARGNSCNSWEDYTEAT